MNERPNPHALALIPVSFRSVAAPTSAPAAVATLRAAVPPPTPAGRAVVTGAVVAQRRPTPLARLFAQFGHPSGRLGAVAGRVMAWENRGLNALVVDLLAVEPADTVLDVGCGPGVAVALAARHASHVVGADPSPVMIAQARRRNRAAIAARRVEVAGAPAERLPYADGRFTAALSVNAIAHWTDEAAGIAELHRVLAPGGRLVLAFRAQRDAAAADPHAHGADPEEVAARTALLHAAGFAGVDRRDHHRAREHLITLSARKPATED